MFGDNNNNNNNNQFLHHAQMMGFVNTLKTGEPTVDMILALLVPYIIGRLLNDLKPYLQKLIGSFRKQKEATAYYERSIVSCSGERMNGDGTFFNNSFNAYLVKAIIHYVNNNCNLEMKNGEMYLTALDASQVTQQQHRSRRAGGGNNNTTVTILEMTEVGETPRAGEWHNLGPFGDTNGGGECTNVEMKFGQSKPKEKEGSKEGSSTANQSNSSGETRIEINLRSTSKESIRTFVKTCRSWYLDEIRKSQTDDRYLFDLKSCTGSVPTHQAYKLGEEKTFETLFSRPSRELLGIVDQFQAKQGKYAIKGYPYKLGLLLSGPAGTGKTSLIKALSHYTRRHVVTIPLNRVSTNAQLMNVFFNRQYSANGNPHMLDFTDVIYVLEDVDACTDVVFKRTNYGSAPSSEKQKLSKKRELENQNKKAESRRIKEAARESANNSLLTDKLNLSGLLNALDGVCETPGRIIIMTTNRPDMLDPALIRPGRIDRHLHLGEMELDDICAMLKHYYPNDESYDRDCDHEDKIRRGLQKLLGQEGVTPAQVEQLVAKAETVEGFLDCLDARESKAVNTVDDSSTPQDNDEDDNSTASSSSSSSSAMSSNENLDNNHGQPVTHTFGKENSDLFEFLNEQLEVNHGDY